MRKMSNGPLDTSRAVLTTMIAAFSVATGMAGPLSPASAADSPTVLAQAQPKGKQPAAKASAEANPPATQEAAAQATGSAWAVSCSNQLQNKLVCEMTQNIIEQRNGAQLVLISVKGTSDGSSTAMLMRLFHGVYLPGGVSVAIDDQPPQVLQFQKSDRFGAYAALPLTDKVINELKKGKQLKLAAQINPGEELRITGSLQGFGPAFDKVVSIR